jgi:3-hydroxyisobutyrate dehydrogenase-like beta-hydroxyacid dehydrogenase
LVDWPGEPIVFDVRPDATTPFAEAGVRVADAVGDVAAADIISVMLFDDEQVRDVTNRPSDRDDRHRRRELPDRLVDLDTSR